MMSNINKTTWQDLSYLHYHELFLELDFKHNSKYLSLFVFVRHKYKALFGYLLKKLSHSAAHLLNLSILFLIAVQYFF